MQQVPRSAKEVKSGKQGNPTPFTSTAQAAYGFQSIQFNSNHCLQLS